MATRFTGGCLCGRVRYECSADPFFMGNCHCRDCQKASGGAYEPDIGLPAAALKITGVVKYYDTKADSGNTLSRGGPLGSGVRGQVYYRSMCERGKQAPPYVSSNLLS